MMYASLATCPIEFYREQSEKSKAASDAFEKWNEIGNMIGIKRIDGLVEIQTRLNRISAKGFSTLVCDLERMLDDMTNPDKKQPYRAQWTFKVSKETEILFHYFYRLRHQQFRLHAREEDKSTVGWYRYGNDGFIKAEKKYAWNFIKFASLIALKGGSTSKFNDFKREEQD